MAAQRIQSWAITLIAYNFEIKYKETSDHANADELSRLPTGTDENFDREKSCYFMSLDNFPMKRDNFKYSKLNKRLRSAFYFVKNCWPNEHGLDQQYLTPFLLTLFRNRIYSSRHFRCA